METLVAPNLPPTSGAQYREMALPPPSQSASAAASPASRHQQKPADRVHHHNTSPSTHSHQVGQAPHAAHSLPFPQSQYHPSSGSFRSYEAAGPTASSQESLHSATSHGSSSAASRVLNSQSSHTTLDTNDTSPSSSSPSHQQKSQDQWPLTQHGIHRVRTPEGQVDGHGQARQYHQPGQGSPIGMTSPSTRHKRTASGLMKAPSAVSPTRGNNALSSSPVRDRRAESVSSNGSRAGEAAAQLKTRLAYAMAKVQHGWQNHNIDQVEVLASKLPSNIRTTTVSSPSASSATRGLVSPRTALTNGAARLSMHDSRPIEYPSSNSAVQSPPSKRRSGAGLVSWAGADTIIPPHDSQHRRNESSNSRFGPSLAPAADIRPSTSASSTSATSPTHTRNTSSSSTANHLRTPTTPRSHKPRHNLPAHLQTSSTSHAQAEQEAIASLMLMHSPSGSGSAPVSASGSKLPPFPYGQPPYTSTSGSSSQSSPRRKDVHLDFPPVSAAPLSNHPAAAGPGTSTQQQQQQQQQSSPLRAHAVLAPNRPTTTLNRHESSESAASFASQSSSSASLGSHERSEGRGGSETREGRERLLDEVEEGSA